MHFHLKMPIQNHTYFQNFILCEKKFLNGIFDYLETTLE
jgi:hypothetical protein